MKAYSVVVIGSGFGGICSAIRLLKAGITDFRLLERRAFMGGTWCQNTYPGAAVDVHSPLYSISSEPYVWKKMFADQAELSNYTNYVIDKHHLRDKADVNTTVTGLHWDEATQVWVISTAEGETYHAQFVINAMGPLSTPAIPEFEGLGSFQGVSFHTNEWNHEFDYKDKRVAIVGSGASAAQVIPAIAPDVAHLHVFQRTPHWVMRRGDRDFSAREQKWLGRPWAYRWLRNVIYWGLELRVIGFKYSSKSLYKHAQKPALNFLSEQVKSPELRQKLTPDYTIGCKRIIISNTLLPTYERDNVSLHDKTQAIAQITPTGIRTMDGQEIALDAIIYATGYDAANGEAGRAVVGKNGLNLADYWSEFPRAYLGTAMPQFPNLFLIIGPNTGIGHTSAIFIMEAQLNYIINSIQAVHKWGARSIEVRAEVEKRYTEHIHKEMDKTVWKIGGCHSWYQSKNGKVIAMFPGFSFSYYLMTRFFKQNNHVFQGKVL